MAKWTNLLTVRRREKTDDEGNTEIINYGVLHPSVKVLVGRNFNAETKTYESYEEVDLGDFRTVQFQDPVASLDNLKAKGHVDDAEYNAKLQTINEKNIRFNVVIPPATK